MVDHLVLAGAGHTHALILLRWAMNPHLRPKCLITLVTRDSATIYSGMFPGVISRFYQLEEALIDIRLLAHQAGVSLIVGEINSLDLSCNRLFLENRPSIKFSQLSLDVGSETILDNSLKKIINHESLAIPIKPFEKALKWIEHIEKSLIFENCDPLTVIGSGLAAVEIVLALRKRWPSCPLRLQAFSEKLKPSFKKALSIAKIQLISYKEPVPGLALICTGSKAPEWLASSGLHVGDSGRVLTHKNFRAFGRKDIFAVGDCGLIRKKKRPPSGVWAVKAAIPLAKNIEGFFLGRTPMSWSPPKLSLLLIGVHREKKSSMAFLMWGSLLIGPHQFFWYLKRIIDRRFVRKFINISSMALQRGEEVLCRGCAAKVATQPLTGALKGAHLSELCDSPEDAAVVAELNDKYWLQSIDGFPALLSDPWLNARLTTLHACSDLWARGASVSSAQCVVTLPSVHAILQQEILTQSLLGIKSVLEIQGARLIGGHTFESRTDVGKNISLGIEISIAINGLVKSGRSIWSKAGLQPGDSILISRGIGSGVIFAASMQGFNSSKFFDSALKKLSESQHTLIESLHSKSLEASNKGLIHACTDITGFGLLGHLGEILQATNIQRLKVDLPLVQANIFASAIPELKGAKYLLQEGYQSTFSPSNEIYLTMLDSNDKSYRSVNLVNDNSFSNEEELLIIRKLLIDPQTCGPLLIACENKYAKELIDNGPWHQIGVVGLM